MLTRVSCRRPPRHPRRHPPRHPPGRLRAFGGRLGALACTLAGLVGHLAGAATAQAQEAAPVDSSRPPCEIGVALSGGGARGIAHIGVLAALEEMGVRVDCIAGTSMGSIIGALYASGYTPAELERIVLSLEWEGAFSRQPERAAIPLRHRLDQRRALFPLELEGWRLRLPEAALPDYRINRFLTEYLAPPGFLAAGDFGRLPRQFAAVAADLRTGERVVLEGGNLVRAVRASMSVPLAFPPVRIDGRVLVDGGIADNLPVGVARDMGARVVIAVDTRSRAEEDDRLDDLMSIIRQLNNVVLAGRNDLYAATPDVVVEPDLGDHYFGDYSGLPALIAAGHEAARARADDIRALVAPSPAAGVSGFSAVPWRSSATASGSASAASGSSATASGPAVAALGSAPVALGVGAARSFSSEGVPLGERTVTDVMVDGHTYHQDDAVLRDFRIVPGERFSMQRALLGMDAVVSAHFVETVWLDFEPTASDGVRVLLHVVDEERALVELAVNYNDEDEVGGFARLRSRNTLGIGEEARIEVFGSDREAGFELRLSGNRVAGSRWGWQARGRIERDKPRFFVDGEFVNRAEFVRRGVQLAADRPLPAGGLAVVGARAESVEVQERLGLPFEPVTDRLRVLEGRLLWDTLDDPALPRRGSFVEVRLQRSLASLGGSVSFWRGEVGARSVVHLAARHQLEGRMWVGAADGDVPVHQLFQVGGPVFLPGRHTEELWGDRTAVAAIEYRYLPTASLSVGGRVGVGQVWLDGGPVGPGLPKWGSGVELGYRSAIGPVRVAFGVDESGGGELSLSIGFR